MNRTTTDTAYSGADLLVRDLATGSTRNIGNVSQYDFDASGRLLAYTVDAIGNHGNRVYLLTLGSGAMRTLASATAGFSDLAWSHEGASLLAFRGDKAKDKNAARQCAAGAGRHRVCACRNLANPYADFYRINGETGARSLIEENVPRTMGMDKPAPKWMSEGVPQVKKGGSIS